MTVNTALTAQQRKQYLDLKYPGYSVSLVLDKEYQGELPIIEVSGKGFDIICSEYQRFNMQRRDDGPLWDHFYEKISVPKGLPMKDPQNQPDLEWLKHHVDQNRMSVERLVAAAKVAQPHSWTCEGTLLTNPTTGETCKGILVSNLLMFNLQLGADQIHQRIRRIRRYALHLQLTEVSVREGTVQYQDNGLVLAVVKYQPDGKVELLVTASESAGLVFEFTE